MGTTKCEGSLLRVEQPTDTDRLSVSPTLKSLGTHWDSAAGLDECQI